MEEEDAIIADFVVVFGKREHDSGKHALSLKSLVRVLFLHKRYYESEQEKYKYYQEITVGDLLRRLVLARSYRLLMILCFIVRESFVKPRSDFVPKFGKAYILRRQF